jgi:iron complex outermembrane receptor protein
VDIKGFEANVDWEPVSGLTFYASGNLTDSVIKENRARPNTVGNSSPYTADYTVNAGTQLLVPVSSKLKALFKLDYRLTGPTWFQTVQAQEVPTLFSAGLGAAGNANFYSPADAFGLVDLRVGLEGKAGGHRCSRRIFQQEICERCRHMTEFAGAFAGPGALRLIGMEVGYKF